MTLSLIVAVAEGGVIGRGGSLPWRLPADLARFKRLTMGHTLVMGRKTFESIGRPLPGRSVVVLTRSRHVRPPGVETAFSIEAALRRAAPEEEVFVAGGAEVYQQALPLADRLYITRVHARVEGDVLFPEFARSQWLLKEEIHRGADERNAYPMTFQVYQFPLTLGPRETP